MKESERIITILEMKDVPTIKRTWSLEVLRKIVNSGPQLPPPKPPVYPEEAKRLNRA